MKDVQNLPADQTQSMQSLSPQEVDRHRAQIGLEVEIAMEEFWKDFDDKRLKPAVLARWMDKLQSWPIEQIRAAFAERENSNPKHKPRRGEILEILKRNRSEDARNSVIERMLASSSPAVREAGEKMKREYQTISERSRQRCPQK